MTLNQMFNINRIMRIMNTNIKIIICLLLAMFSVIGCGDDADVIIDSDSEPSVEYVKFIPEDPYNYWVSEHKDTLYFFESGGNPRDGLLLEFKSVTPQHNFDLPYLYYTDSDSLYVPLRQTHSSNSYKPLIGYPVEWGEGEFTVSFYQGREVATYKQLSLADFEKAEPRPVKPNPDVPQIERVTEDPWSWVNEANDTIYFSGSPDGKPEQDGGTLYFKNMAFNPISQIPYRYCVSPDTLYVYFKQYYESDTNNPLIGYPVEWGEDAFTLYDYQGIQKATYKQLKL